MKPNLNINMKPVFSINSAICSTVQYSCTPYNKLSFVFLCLTAGQRSSPFLSKSSGVLPSLANQSETSPNCHASVSCTWLSDNAVFRDPLSADSDPWCVLESLERMTNYMDFDWQIDCGRLSKDSIPIFSQHCISDFDSQ